MNPRTHKIRAREFLLLAICRQSKSEELRSVESSQSFSFSKYGTDCARNAPAKTRVQEKQAIRSTLFPCMACDDSKKSLRWLPERVSRA